MIPSNLPPKTTRSEHSPQFGSRARGQQVQGQQSTNSPPRPGTPPPMNAPTRAQIRLNIIPAPQQRTAIARTETPKRSRAETTIGSRTHRSGSQARSEKTAELHDIREETSRSGSPTRREIPTDTELHELNADSIQEVEIETAIVVERSAETSSESSRSSRSARSSEERSHHTSSSEKDKGFVVTMDLTHGDEDSRSVSEEDSSSSHEAEHTLSNLKGRSLETGTPRWEPIKPHRSPLDQLIPREGAVRFSKRNRTKIFDKAVSQGTVDKRKKLMRQGTGLPSTRSHQGSAPSARHPIGRVQSLPQATPPEKKESSTTVVQDSFGAGSEKEEKKV